MKNFHYCFVLVLMVCMSFYSANLQAQQEDFSIYEPASPTILDKLYSESLRSIGASEAQIEAVLLAGDQYYEQLNELQYAFIYHEDLDEEEANIEAALINKVREILTEKQFADLEKYSYNYDDEDDDVIFDGSNWDETAFVKAATEFFKSEFEFLDISQEQATALAQKQAGIFKENKSAEYEELMALTFKEVLTPEQFEKYAINKTEQKAIAEQQALEEMEMENADMDEISEDVSIEEVIQEDQSITEEESYVDVDELNERMAKIEEKRLQREAEQLAFMKTMMASFKTYFIPERAIIRAKIEASISAEDLAVLEGLRTKYAALVAEYEQIIAERYSLSGREVSEMEKYTIEAKIYAEKEILNFDKSQRTNVLKEMVQADRATFNLCKELASRYDKVMDDAAKETDLLIVAWFMQLVPQLPESVAMPENVQEEIRNEIIKPVYDTKEVEYYRNIAFLLVRPGEYNPSDLQSNRLIHELSAFPVPAKDFQKLNFTLAADGIVIIDIVSQDGKLIKQVQNGNMTKGVHQINVDIQDLPARAFFYRISNAQGTSLVKSIKAN
ncbi:MAG: hypothetical protein GC192_03470 [Bacteroidetes bacterium]|nr:hypothetical protein [Bacteroidota bacterium]